MIEELKNKNSDEIHTFAEGKIGPVLDAMTLISNFMSSEFSSFDINKRIRDSFLQLYDDSQRIQVLLEMRAKQQKKENEYNEY
jgi:hypothetical protein